jgi:hypothetical protein
MPAQRLGLPERLNRKVLFAVELVDPIALSLVWRGVLAQAEGLARPAIVSRSGRFVWLQEADLWPARVTVDPGALPFATQISPPPPRPADVTKATPQERLLRITLRLTSAYDLADGITAIRGRLCERNDDQSPPVAGALVQLAWHDDHSGNWLPPKPQPQAVVAHDVAPPSPPETETDENGQFLAFVRLNPPKPAQPDIVDGMLAVRLQFTRDRTHPVTRATPNDFPFLHPNMPAAAPAPKGRIPEGRALARDLRLGWADLVPI